MKAYRMFEWKKGGRLVDDMEIPEPNAGEVLLKVGGNGICQSDIHLMYEWESSPPHLKIELPMTVGHEIAGWIEKIGNGVTGLEKGLACVVTIAGCGRCRFCVNGYNNYCINLEPQPGMGKDGGLAEYVVVNSNGVLPIGDIEPYKAAPLTDAGLTSLHAIKRIEHLLFPGANVVVIGVGGLGHMAVMLLKSLYFVNVIAVDIKEKSLMFAKKLGADYNLLFNEESLREINKIVKNKKVQVVLDFVGNGETISLGAKVLERLGEIVVIGRGKGSFQFKDRAIPYGASISTTFGGTKAELFELIELMKLFIIEPVITKFNLEEIDSAFDKLKNNEITGRAVIIP